MQMRGGRAAVSAKDAGFPKEPMAEGVIDLFRKVRQGSVEEKLSAIPMISANIDSKEISPREAIGILMEALGDDSRLVRWSAILAMARRGSDMIEGLRAGLRNNDPKVRAMSSAMISKVIENNPGIYRCSSPMAGIVYEEIKSVSRDLFISLLDDQRAVRMHSLAALRQLAKRSPAVILDEADSFMDGNEPELDCRMVLLRRDAQEAIIERGKPC
jgi:hypothetical protein